MTYCDDYQIIMSRIIQILGWVNNIRGSLTDKTSHSLVQVYQISGRTCSLHVEVP